MSWARKVYSPRLRPRKPVPCSSFFIIKPTKSLKITKEPYILNLQFAKEKNLQYLLTVYVNNIVVDSAAFPHDWLLCICILQLGIWVYFQMPTHYSKVSPPNSSPWLRWSLQTFIRETRSSGMPDALQKSVPLSPSLTLCPGIVWIDKDAANQTWNLIPFFDVLFNGR